MMNTNVQLSGVRQFVSRHCTHCSADMQAISLIYKAAEAASSINPDRSLNVEEVYVDGYGSILHGASRSYAEFVEIYLVSA
jgi:hypothetical protein